jgi:hypothetical protein
LSGHVGLYCIFELYYLFLDFTYFFSSCQLTVDVKQALDSGNGDSANLG